MNENKYILISLVKNSDDVPTYMCYDMKEGVHRASLNLELRHGIKIELTECFKSNYIIRVSGQSYAMEKFMKSYGRRLRGITAYLLKTYPEKYKPLRIGKRLFTYKDVSEVLNDNKV